MQISLIVFDSLKYLIKSINMHCKECLQNKHNMVASLCASRFECCRFRVVLGMLSGHFVCVLSDVFGVSVFQCSLHRMLSQVGSVRVCVF